VAGARTSECNIDHIHYRLDRHDLLALNLFFGMTQAPFQAIFSQRFGLKKPGQVIAACPQLATARGAAIPCFVSTGSHAQDRDR
jgi:hypothetical protein